MKSRRALAITIITLAISWLALPAQANLITNGSFETGPAPGSFLTGC